MNENKKRLSDVAAPLNQRKINSQDNPHYFVN
jgi:hypothetical protein